MSMPDARRTAAVLMTSLALLTCSCAVTTPGSWAASGASSAAVGDPPANPDRGDSSTSGAGWWAWALMLGFGTALAVMAGRGASKAPERAAERRRRRAAKHPEAA
jgi:hypothetical protein